MQPGGDFAGVAEDANVHRKEPSDRGRLDLHLDDARLRVQMIVGVEGCVEAETRAEREDHVGLARQPRCDHVAARTNLPGVQRVRAGHGIAMTGRQRHRCAQALGQRQCDGGMAAVLHAATGEDQRPLGASQQTRPLLDQRRRPAATTVHLPTGRRQRGGDLHLRSQQVARDVQRHRPAARRGRHTKRFAHHLADPRRLRHQPGLLGDRREQRGLVDLLERIPVPVRRRQRPGNRHHRRVGRLRLRQTGHEIGRTRAVLAREDYTGAAARAGITIGHVGAGALIAHADEADRRLRMQRVEDLHPGRANQAEHMRYPFRLQRRHHRLTACLCACVLAHRALPVCCDQAAARAASHVLTTAR